MRAVDIGIGHDDDFVIPELVGIELLAPNAGPERGDQGGDLLARQHFVKPGALNIEDLAAQRQHRLERAVAAVFG